MARKARDKTGRLRKKGFCALVSIDIRNAFNSVRWENCIEALETKSVPAYLTRMLDNYLSERWVVYEGDSWTVKEEMTCGAPQGSRIGPIIWNITYDDFLKMDLPEATELVGFADDTLIVCAADNVDILELRINESLRRAKRWLDGRGLQMAIHKTEAVLVTDRRSFRTPVIELDGMEIKWKNQLTHLGVELDRKLNFRPHVAKAINKAIESGGNISRLMPNVGGPREAKRRVLASVFHSKLLYAAPVWAAVTSNYSLEGKLASAQRGVALRIISAYRTVSTSAILVLASVPPIDLLVLERKEVYSQNKERACLGSEEENRRIKAEVKKEARARLTREWQEPWLKASTGRWTHQLIPQLPMWLGRKHGEVGFHLTQALTGHGCFNAYLKRFNIRQSESCDFCNDPVDDAKHTLFACQRWQTYREEMNTETGIEVQPENMVSLMVESEEKWRSIETFIVRTMRDKILESRRFGSNG